MVFQHARDPCACRGFNRFDDSVTQNTHSTHNLVGDTDIFVLPPIGEMYPRKTNFASYSTAHRKLPTSFDSNIT